MIRPRGTEEHFPMTRTPTQLVSDHLAANPAILRDARRRLTLADNPVHVRDRIACALEHPERRGYAVVRNERMIRTHAHLGALRRALVQWAAYYAPRDIGGYHALLAWALARVDWSAVIQSVALSPQRSVENKVERRDRGDRRGRRGRFLFISSLCSPRALRPLR
jgi:hypothetical protein